MALELRPHSKHDDEADDRTPPAGPLTYEQFLDWADKDTYAEWVDGKVEMSSPASLPHQDLAGFLGAIMRSFVEDTGAGTVLLAPFQMKLSNVRRGREPDLLFVATENVDRLRQNFLDGPADLAVEIVSPESALRDRGAKYAEYEAGGVREYWVLDLEERRADFFVRDADGRYERAHPDANGVYRATALPAFRLDVNGLWQRPLPTLREALRRWETPRG